jgi:transposase
MTSRVASFLSAIYESDLPPGHQLTAYVVASVVARGEGLSTKDLADRLGVSESTARRRLADLKARGYLDWTPGTGRDASTYELRGWSPRVVTPEAQIAPEPPTEPEPEGVRGWSRFWRTTRYRQWRRRWAME